MTGLLALFACVAAGCIAFGAYIAYSALVAAHRDALESRYVIAAQRVAGTAELAAAFGIALPAQSTLAQLVENEARLDPSIAELDVLDETGAILFSSLPSRVGTTPPTDTHLAVVRPIRNDLGKQTGSARVRYDERVLQSARQTMAAELRGVAIPGMALACLATLLIGLVLVRRLQRQARRAADPASWPPAARQALADVDATHARIAARLQAGRP